MKEGLKKETHVISFSLDQIPEGKYLETIQSSEHFLVLRNKFIVRKGFVHIDS